MNRAPEDLPTSSLELPLKGFPFLLVISGAYCRARMKLKDDFIEARASLGSLEKISLSVGLGRFDADFLVSWGQGDSAAWSALEEALHDEEGLVHFFKR